MYSRIIVALSAVTIFAAACGGGSGDSTPDGASADDSAIVEMLSVVPDTPDVRRLVVATDYERAIAAAGLDPATAEADPQGFLVALTLVPVDGNSGEARPLALPTGFEAGAIELEAWRTEYGFDILAVRASLTAGQLPDDYRVYALAVDEATVDSAVRSDPLWQDQLTDVSRAGIDYYRWSTDATTDLERRSPVRTLGRGGQLAVVDGVAVRTVQDSTMRAALDSVAAGTTLADATDVRDVVSALEAESVHSLFLSSDRYGALDAAALESADDLADLGDEPTLAPYTLLGAGLALVDGAHQVVVALAHADAEAAQENADRLRAIVETGTSVATSGAWSDILDIRSIDARDKLVVATFGVSAERSPSIYIEAFLRRDSLYWVS